MGGEERGGLAGHVNGLAEAEARRELEWCCGAGRWVERMIALRPYADDAHLLAEAERVWWSLEPEDWLEAFASHPRIGERESAAERPSDTAAWSREEQACMEASAEEEKRDMAAANREYEERFGHIFLICATGRGAEEMLSEARRRLTNHPAAELREAAGEQARITRLRLKKLVG